MASWQRTFDRLDKISRSRALTADESRMLERAIKEIDAPRNRPRGRPGGNSWSREEEARFCDLIAEGMSPREAGVAIGKTESAGAGKFDRIKAHYGWQAA
jgi:hypothetical protein